MGSLEKLQQTSDELGTEPNVIQIPMLQLEKVKIKQRNFVVKQTLVSGSNSHIYGHPVNGKYGVAIGLGGGQIVYGQSGIEVTIELIRRRYDWDSRLELEKGAKSGNIDISQGFLQLGNLTIKNISLEHKNN